MRNRRHIKLIDANNKKRRRRSEAGNEEIKKLSRKGAKKGRKLDHAPYVIERDEVEERRCIVRGIGRLSERRCCGCSFSRTAAVEDAPQ